MYCIVLQENIDFAVGTTNLVFTSRHQETVASSEFLSCGITAP